VNWVIRSIETEHLLHAMIEPPMMGCDYCELKL